MKIRLEEFKKMNLAHVKLVGRFDEVGSAYETLFRWAVPKGLVNRPQTKVMTIYHKSPEETGPEKVEQSACISLEDNVTPDGGIEHLKFPGGKYAVGSFEISSNEFSGAWETVCNWVESKGYKMTKGYPFELYHNNHEDHPEKKHIVDICVPVEV